MSVYSKNKEYFGCLRDEANATSACSNSESSGNKPQVANLKFYLGSIASTDNSVKAVFSQSSLEVVESIPVNVKMQTSSKQMEGDCKFQLSLSSGNPEFSLGPKELCLLWGCRMVKEVLRCLMS